MGATVFQIEQFYDEETKKRVTVIMQCPNFWRDIKKTNDIKELEEWFKQKNEKTYDSGLQIAFYKLQSICSNARKIGATLKEAKKEKIHGKTRIVIEFSFLDDALAEDFAEKWKREMLGVVI